MDECQREVRGPRLRCILCPANAGFGVFRGTNHNESLRRDFNHGTLGNAPLCGTERAGERGSTHFSRNSPPSKTSVHGRWANASEMSEGLIRAVFGVPRMRVSVCSVVRATKLKDRNFVSNRGESRLTGCKREIGSCATSKTESEGAI